MALRPGSRLATAPPLHLERILGRSLWLGKSVVAGALGCWLGLIVWSAISSGGPLPAANANPAAIRVLTWNILHGTDRGKALDAVRLAGTEKGVEDGVSAPPAGHLLRSRGPGGTAGIPRGRFTGTSSASGLAAMTVVGRESSARSSLIANGFLSSAGAHFGWKSRSKSPRSIDAGAQNEFAPGCGSETERPAVPFEFTIHTNT